MLAGELGQAWLSKSNQSARGDVPLPSGPHVMLPLTGTLYFTLPFHTAHPAVSSCRA